MTLQDRFHEALATATDVSLLALGDLSSGLILDWAAREPCPREVLDLLGERAAAAFARLDAMDPPPGADPATWGAGLVRFTEAGSEVLARDPRHPEDVICLGLTPGGALEPALALARRLARDLGADGANAPAARP